MPLNNRGLRESAKRRGETQRQGYAALDRLLEEAVYDRFEEVDTRHAAKLRGQNVYIGAMRLGDKLYAVRFKLDVPLHGNGLHYKDHKVTEIEMAPTLFQSSEVGSSYTLQNVNAISDISLGVLRGAVKPSVLENGALSSISPGEYLPPPRDIGSGLSAPLVRRLVQNLGKVARNVAPVRVVQKFEELPDSIRKQYGDKASAIEGVYDPRTRTVWMVADNILDTGRVAEVWMHEQVVHHGLRGLFTPAERRIMLNQLWIGMGGMGNDMIRQIAEKYGVNPRSDESARLTIMEEVLAAMVEKRQLDSLTQQERTWWRRVLAVVLHAWEKLVRAATGRAPRMSHANIDGLLAALGQYVLDGVPNAGMTERATDAQALASMAAASTDTTQQDDAAKKKQPSAFSSEGLARGLRNLRKVLGRGVSEDVEDILKDPDMGRLMSHKDIQLAERLFTLPHWIAKEHTRFSKIYERQLQRVEQRSAALKHSLEQIPLLYDPDAKVRLNPQEMTELTNMIWKWDGKVIAELKDVEKFIVTDKTLNGRGILEMNPEFTPAFERWLDKQPESPRAREAFMQVRKSLDADFLQAYGKMAAMRDLADTDLERYRTSFGNLPNYFPHRRTGQYVVVATTDKGVAGDPRQVIYRQHFDVPVGSTVREEWAKIVAAHKREFPDATWHSPREAEKLPDDVLGAPIDAQAMEQIIKAATARLGNGEEARQVQSVLLDGISDILKARGFGSHGIERQNIPGHETDDVLDILYTYKSGLNGWLTKMEAAADFAAALGKIDAKKTPRLWEYASQYIKDMLRNSDKLDRLTGNIKTVAFAWYLGGSLKTAAVNLTQNFIIGIPRLGHYVTGSSGRWLNAAMDTVGLKYSSMGVTGATRLKEDELRLIQELFGDGVINDAFMEEVRGQLGDGPGKKVWNRFIKFMGMPMSVVERFNRASLALAAYRAARAGALKASYKTELGLKPDEGMDFEQAKTFAAMLVRDSHYVLDKANQPEFFRSSVAGRVFSPAYTFRSFGANTLNLYYRALRHEGAAGAAFVAKSLGATIALGGLTAFPFYATMSALCQAVSGDDDDWTEQIRKALPQHDLMRDVVCYGAPAIMGASIGGSLRMETPLTEGFRKGSTPKAIFQESIGNIIGIPYDIAINRTSRTLEAARNGDHGKMMEAMMPTFLTNMVQAWRLYNEGQTTMTGRPINDPGKQGARKLNAGEAMGKLFGFQPVSSSKSYDAYMAQKHREMVRSEKIGELATAMLEAREVNDLGGVVAVRKKMEVWNEKMAREDKPLMRINMSDILRRVKARRRETRATAKNAAKGREFAQVWGG